MRRVVITGAGVISPVGNTVESFWERIVAGKHGITPISGIDNQTPVKVAAQVHDFDPTQWIDKKEAKRMDRYCQFALAAAMDALKDCGSDLKDLDPYRVGVIAFRVRQPTTSSTSSSTATAIHPAT